MANTTNYSFKKSNLGHPVRDDDIGDNLDLIDAAIKERADETVSAATFVVAASNSLHKERADYVCDGVDDQVEIQAAIDALSEADVIEEFTVSPETRLDAFDEVGTWVGANGDETLSADSADKQQGTASLKIIGGTTNYPGAKKTGLDLDWSTYSIINLWVKASDVWANLLLTLKDTGGNVATFRGQCGVSWRDVEIDLSDSTYGISKDFDWTHVAEINIQSTIKADSYTFRVDDFRLNNWVTLNNTNLIYNEEEISGSVYGVDYELWHGNGKIKAKVGGNLTPSSNYNISYRYSIGGTIQLSEGGFNIQDSIFMDKGNVTLQGLGPETKLIRVGWHAGTDHREHLIFIGVGRIDNAGAGFNNTTISDMELDGGDAYDEGRGVNWKNVFAWGDYRCEFMQNIVLSHLISHDAGSETLCLDYVSHCKMENCVVYRAYWGGLTFAGGFENKIIDCEAYECNPSGCYIGGAIEVTGNWNSVVKDCYVHDSPGGLRMERLSVHGIVNRNGIVKGNLIENIDGIGLYFQSSGIVDSNIVTGNTGKTQTGGNARAVYLAGTSVEWSNIVCSNNIFMQNRTDLAGLMIGTVITSSIITNNIVRGNIRFLEGNENVVLSKNLVIDGSIIPSSTDVKNITYTPCSNHFMDVLAASANHVHAAITGTGAEQEITTAITNPDVPRNISLTNSANSTGDVKIDGVDAKGKQVSDTITIVTGGIAYGVVAFATVSKITIPAGVANPDTISVGISDKLGISNRIYASGDVYKVKVNNADDPTIGTVNTTYDTVDCATINAADDITIWYKSNLNIIF